MSKYFKSLQTNFSLDFLDNKIAEEQEKQKQQQGQGQKAGAPGLKRSPSSARRGSSRIEPPGNRSGSRLRAPDASDGAPAIKGPDPDDFVIGDDESSASISRTATPQPAINEGKDAGSSAATAPAPASTESERSRDKDGGSQEGDKGKGKMAPEEELPELVQKKLAHLEKLTARYQGMVTSKPLHRDWHLLFYSQNLTCTDLLRNYRTAHARVSMIDPFEAALREHTPLTSIGDPGTLVEWLNQRSMQSDMVLQELKKIAGEKNEAEKERDELKTKLEDAEKKVKDAFDEAAGLRKERDEAKAESAKHGDSSANSLGVSKAERKSTEDDAFFSYEDEVSRDGELSKQLAEKDVTLKQKTEELQAYEVREKEHTAYINELSVENASLRKDSETFRNELDVKKVDLDAANKQIEQKDAEIASIKQELAEVIAARDASKEHQDEATLSLVQTEAQLVNIQKEMKDSQEALKKKAAEAEARKSEAEDKLQKYQREHAKNLKEGKYSQDAQKGVDNVRNLVKTLQANLEAKTNEVLIARAQASDMHSAMKIMEAESAQTESTMKYLRDIETTAKSDKQRLHEAEQQRDALQKVVDSKRGHEQKIVTLQMQLKQAMEDRDRAYQNIINCGKCVIPVKQDEVTTPSEVASSSKSRLGSETTNVSTQPTELGSEASTPGTPPALEDEDLQTPTGAAKKKSKKKSKKGKKKPESATGPEGADKTEHASADVTVDDLIRDQTGTAAKLRHQFEGNPLIPLLENMHDYVKKRTEADSDNHDNLIMHLEERIEVAVQNLKNKDVVLRAKDDEILELRQNMLNTISSDAKTILQGQIDDLTKEIAIVKEERDAKNAKLLLLEEQREEAGDAIRRDDSQAWQDLAEEHQKRIDHLEADLKERESTIEALRTEIDALGTDITDKNTTMAKLTEDMAASEVKVAKLQESIKSQIENEELIEILKEEKDELQDSMLELGKEATEAKHELKLVREMRDELQREFDELEQDVAKYRKQVKDAEGRETDLKERANELEVRLQDVTDKAGSSTELEGIKGQMESLKRERESLQDAKDASEAQIKDLTAKHTASSTERDEQHQTVLTELEALKSRASELEKDLAASENLAQQRFKDLTSTKELNEKFQQQLKKLKQESDELRAVKAELEKSSALVKKLEGKAKDLRSEITEYKSQAADRDIEIASLRGKAKTSEDRGKALEESYETARRDLEKTQSARDEAIDAREKLQADCRKLEDELKKQKPRIEDLEKQVQKLTEENNSLKEELQLKATSQASAESFVQSAQDQNRELATRTKEMQERVESLEEELEDTRRSLSERSREGDTMRRLLADAESRADTKVKELREQRDLAIEERDRAESDASTVGRKRAREIEDLRNKLREAEQEASRASEVRKDVEKRERDFRNSRIDLERRLAQAQEDADAARNAMSQLQNSLDEGERQVTQLEKDKQSLKKQVEERETRLERLQKSSKTMAEELQQLKNSAKLRHQQQQQQQIHTGSGSSRTSMESVNRSRIASPGPGRPSTSNGSVTGSPGDVNYVYLRQVLLQFLEQKEKKFQLALVPVLGQLLHFDKAEEQKWTSAIAAK